MKKYFIKANALIANRSYETGLFLLVGVIAVLCYFTFVPNKIVSSYSTSSNLKQTEIIACAPNSFFVLTGSCPKNFSILHMIVADPVVRSKINLSYAGVPQVFFYLSKSLLAKTPSGLGLRKSKSHQQRNLY